MATNDINVKNLIGASVLTFQSASYSPTAINDIDPASATSVALTLSSILAAAAVNSIQFDFGPTRAARYSILSALEWFAAVTAGGLINFYLSGSNNATATDGNPGLASGVDEAYSPTNFTVAEGVAQMDHIGQHVSNGSASDVQMMNCGVFSPRHRYGNLVVVNDTDGTLCGTDDIESCIVFEPIAEVILAAV